MTQSHNTLSLFLTLTLTRGLGQTALSLVSMAMVGKWFTEKPGTAMGIYAVLLSIGSSVAYGILLGAVTPAQWREPWGVMGWLLLTGLAPLCWLFVRSNPPNPSPQPLSPEHQGEGLTLREALMSPAFWAFGLATSFFNLVWSAITLYQREILSDRGFDPDGNTYNLVMGFLFIAGLISNLLSGWLANRGMSLSRLLVAGMAVLGLGLLVFPLVKTQTAAIFYGLLLGIGGGPIVVVFFAVWGQAFGRKHLGKIQAAAQVLTVFASASGPWLLSECKSATGSYLPFFGVSAGVVGVLGVFAWSTALPRRRERVAY
jgi:cyanate permease